MGQAQKSWEHDTVTLPAIPKPKEQDEEVYFLNNARIVFTNNPSIKIVATLNVQNFLASLLQGK